ncbi:phospholipid carrier-dependent glycosyltransferase [Streptomyces sp. NPDC016309]|uniref:phospholipid carrier-dependent glycosyltransferase n=1 Tax=Streptomyces sp. NPDC016309 TaxID=3364965 RepID=UPI0036F9DB84
MSSTATRTKAPSAPASASRRSSLRAPVVWAVAIVVFALAAGLRLVHIGSSADVFTDEVLYRDLGHSTAVLGYPNESGHPFFLHPPGFFYLLAGWEFLSGHQGDPVASVYDMRILNALLAGATAAALAVLVARVSRSWPAAAAAGALFALDAFCIRQNGRVLLETSMMLPVVAGFAVLLPLFAHPPPRRAGLRAASAGLLFGLAILTKDWAVFVTIVPVLFATAIGRQPPRRLLLCAVGLSAVPYAVYVSVVALSGQLGWFLEVKGQGIQRLLGAVQATGFNSAESPSVVSRLIEEAPTFAGAYLLLVAGTVALVVLLFRGNPAERMVGLWQLSGVCALLYAVFFGTLEEHYLYLLSVPSVAAVAVAVRLVLRTRKGNSARICHSIAVVGLAVVLGLSSTSYFVGRTEPDDGYARLRAYVTKHIPAGSAITVVDGTPSLSPKRDGRTSVLEDRYRIGRWVTPQARAAARVQYVIVPWKEVREGYAFLTVGRTQRLVAQGQLVFSFNGRTYGTLAVYRLPLTDPSAAAERLPQRP